MTHLSAKTWLCFCVCSAAVRAPGQQPATAPANPAAPASAPAASVPHMKLSTMNWDFGSIWDTEKSQFTLKVTNDGTGELRFEAKPSCGCISVQVIKRTIPPGQSADMQVTFDPKGKQGKTEQTIEFTSNDPAFASYQFTIGGTVKRAVTMEPYGGIWMRTANSAAGQTPRVVRLKNEMSEPMKLTLTANTAKDWLDVEIKEVTPGLLYELVSRTTQELKPGRLRGSLTLSTGLSRESTYRVPVSFDVVGLLHAEPRAIMVDDNIAGRPYPIQLLYFGTNPDLDLARSEAQPSPVEVHMGQMGAINPGWEAFAPPIKRMTRANITIPKPADVPPQGITVRFYASDPNCPVAEVLLTKDVQTFGRVVHGPPDDAAH